MLGFGPVRIEPGDRARVVARPQLPFRGRRLAYAGPPSTFALCDVLVGWNSQLAGAAAIPMETFPPLPPDLASASSWLTNCGVQDRAPAGIDVTLVVQNVSRTSAEFSAVMFGEVEPPL